MITYPPGRGPARTADGGAPRVCPHCWGVNPGPFQLCVRCGASLDTLLQETGGLRRTAPIQSPMPVATEGRLRVWQRAVVGLFLLGLALTYLSHLLPAPQPAPAGASPTPHRLP